MIATALWLLFRAFSAGLTARTARREATGFFTLSRGGTETRAFWRGLRRRDLPLPHEPMAYGGGGYARFGRFLVGGSGRGSGSRRRDGRVWASYGDGSGTFDVGYAALDLPAVRLYPLVGIGGGGAGFRIGTRDKGTGREALPSAGMGGMMVQLGWGLEYRLMLWGTAGLVIGVQAGAMVMPLRFGWYGRGLDGERVPRLRFSRPFVRLMIGGTTRG